VVGKAAEHPGLDRAAPATLGYRGGVPALKLCWRIALYH
jgi:hypothetical protein